MITNCADKWCAHPQDRHHQDDGSCQICGCTQWVAPFAQYPLNYDNSDLVCMGCGIDLPINTPFKEVLSGFSEQTPVVEIMCVYCS